MDHNRTLGKLRSQNDKLRAQLKELSAKLTDTLEKLKLKKEQEYHVQDFRDEIVRKELENANKQIVQYQKDIMKLKARIQVTHTVER